MSIDQRRISTYPEISGELSDTNGQMPILLVFRLRQLELKPDVILPGIDCSVTGLGVIRSVSLFRIVISDTVVVCKFEDIRGVQHDQSGAVDIQGHVAHVRVVWVQLSVWWQL